MELILLIILISIVICSRSIKKVNPFEAHIIERLEAYHKTVTEGFYFINPFTDKIRSIVDLREQFLLLQPQVFITNDNISISINTAISYQIIDPYKSIYNIQNLKSAISTLTATTLRDIVEKMDLDNIFSSKTQIDEQLSKKITEYADNWGLILNRAEIKDITPQKEFLDI